MSTLTWSAVLVLVSLVWSGVSSGAAEARPQDAQANAEWWVSSMQAAREPARSQRSGRSARQAGPESRSLSADEGSRGNRGVGPRPGAWCGWWMRTQRGGGPEYNLAWNWTKYGSPGSPQVGAVVVWRHHVGMITGQAANGQWIVKSGNDGGRVRERPRSIAGAVIRV
jgi:hypothetical protein